MAVFLPAALLAGGPAPAATESLAASGREPSSRPGARAREAIFLVEADDRRGVGFLADSSGLILTSSELLGPAEYLAVHVGPGRKVFAQVLARYAFRRIAVVRVNPRAVTGLEPLHPAGPGAEPLVPGDRIVAVRRPKGPEPTWVAGVAAKVRRGSILFDPALEPDSLGSPVLDLSNRVVGIKASNLWGRPGKTYVVRIHLAEGALAEARARVARHELPPPADSLPVASPCPYPSETLEALADSLPDPRAYRMRAGGFQLDFLTPPLLHALGRRERGRAIAPGARGAQREEIRYDPGEGFLRWQRHDRLEAVVIVQAVPDIRIHKGSVAGVTAYWLIYPPLLVLECLAAAFGGGSCGSGSDPLPPPHLAYRFRPSFQEMRLLREGVEVPPILPARSCGPLVLRVASSDEERGRKKRIRGCYGVYAYPPEAFEPGASLAIQLFNEKNPGRPETVSLSPEIVERLRADFRPYFEAIQRGTAPDPAEPCYHPRIRSDPKPAHVRGGSDP